MLVRKKEDIFLHSSFGFLVSSSLSPKLRNIQFYERTAFEYLCPR